MQRAVPRSKKPPVLLAKLLRQRLKPSDDYRTIRLQIDTAPPRTPKSPRHKPHSLAVPPEGNCSSQPVAVFSHNQVRGIRIVVVINTTASATCSNAPDSRKSANTGRRSDRSSTLRVICDRPTISRRSRRPMLELRHNPAHFLLARRHLRRRPQQLEIVDKDDVTTRPRVVRIDGPRARVMQRYRKRLLSRGSSPCGR